MKIQIRFYEAEKNTLLKSSLDALKYFLELSQNPTAMYKNTLECSKLRAIYMDKKCFHGKVDTNFEKHYVPKTFSFP